MLFPVFLTDQRVYFDFRDRFFVMGRLRIVDRDLAFAWPGRFGYRGLEVLLQCGYPTLLSQAEQETLTGSALNFVTLGPRPILIGFGDHLSHRMG